MRTRHPLLGYLLVAGAMTLTASSCAHRVDFDLPRDHPPSVKVINNNFNDVDIFAEGTGNIRKRLGTVVGRTSSTFDLPPSYVAFGDLRLFGIPIAGFGTADSGTLQVAANQQVVFMLQAELGMSTATIVQQ